jgi:hypothetical protein
MNSLRRVMRVHVVPIMAGCRRARPLTGQRHCRQRAQQERPAERDTSHHPSHSRGQYTSDIRNSPRQLTNFAPDFNVRDFDISPDGREIVVEQVQEHSDIVLIELPRR